MLITLLVAVLLSLLLSVVGKLLVSKSAKLACRAVGWLLLMGAMFPWCLVLYLCYFMFTGFLKPGYHALNDIDGVVYSRERVTVGGHQAVVHVVEVDLRLVDVAVSKPVDAGAELENEAMTTSDALMRAQADLAINASFFGPFRDIHLFDYYPRSGDKVSPVGATFSGNALHGLLDVEWPFLVVYQDGTLDIKAYDESFIYSAIDQELISYLLSGRTLLIDDGMSKVNEKPRFYPRTTIGLSQDQHTLWLFVVDGKQTFYSDGISLQALADLMLSKGVYRGLELDGGGSATLVWRNPVSHQAELVNRPIHTKIPNRERPVANHLLIHVKQ